MRKVIGFYEGPFVGTSASCAFLVPTHLSEEQVLDCIAGWAYEEHDNWVDEAEEQGLFDDGPDYWFEDYDSEKHDMLRAGGGSFEDDF